MKRSLMTADILQALASAERAPGWNNRSRDVQRFTVGACTLYIVPFRRWAYRRMERQAEAWQTEQVPR